MASMRTAGSEQFWVLRRNGEVLRIAKLSDRGAWAYILGEWVSMPDLRRTIYEDVSSDFELITEDEAETLLESYVPNRFDVERFSAKGH